MLILLFFAANSFSQKIFKNSISSHTDHIYIEFNVIDHLELIVDDDHNFITIIAESEDQIVQNFVVEDKNGIVFIKGKNNYISDYSNNIDKFCSIQPIYTSYKIKVPSGKNLNISFSEGNFY